jgi:gliding motility-associated-like protein
VNNLVLYIFFTLVSTTIAVAQNLVPNHSFEEFLECPNGTAQFQTVATWFNPTASSPDYYNRCFGELPPGSFGPGIPANDWGYQEAQDGDAYAGLLTFFAPDLEVSIQREYIAIELFSELVAGQYYFWCMYVSLIDSMEYYSNNIGIALTEEMVTDFSTPFMLLELPVYGNWETPVSDYVNWTQIGGVFTAQGGEKFLYIGNFFSDADTELIKFQDNDRGGAGTAYYIDNVYLGLQPCVEPSIEIPNVFTPNGDGINDTYRTRDEGLFGKEMTILNRWGNVVFEGKDNQGWDGTTQNGKACADGVYFVKVEYTNPTNNKRETKTGYVHLIR